MKVYQKRLTAWFNDIGWKPQDFQLQAWTAWWEGKDGMVLAPTGSGKTYALILPALISLPDPESAEGKGVQVLWITPLRALSVEILKTTQAAIEGLGLSLQVALRTGDTPNNQREYIKKHPPQVLITTPETLHLMLAQSHYRDYFKGLKAVVVDEWHELLGTKRGVQVELALSRFKHLLPGLKIWGISATIGNLEEAIQILRGVGATRPFELVRSEIAKTPAILSVLPDEVEMLPWAGHLGIKMLAKVYELIMAHQSTLVFTNTRAQAEIWYQQLLAFAPDLAGVMAMHHGSISKDLRDWVEQSLREGQLKVVVCTSSLDLGVDFTPVEAVVQIGSPKGVARAMQRAGRSGHQPGGKAVLYFVPTHALELLEGAALRDAILRQQLESRIPHIRSFDVLIQYLVTLAAGDGFLESEIYSEILQTVCFSSVSPEEWAWVLDFITTGGAMYAYDEFKRVSAYPNGFFKISSTKLALQHKLNIGTISSDASYAVRFVSGKHLGTVEEWFVNQLQPGDVFWFSGRALELIRIKDLILQVKPSAVNRGKVPAWMGGRMSLSSQLSEQIRYQLFQAKDGNWNSPELKAIAPMLLLQQERSLLPGPEEFLVEYFKTNEGFHLLVYPFEGRFVHEGLAALLAYRISRTIPISFSIAMNDYGFELLSDQELPLESLIKPELFTTKSLQADILNSVNATEMARQKFRDIARISGLLFEGFPGKMKKARHLRSNSNLLFSVFQDYDASNLLLVQAYEEVKYFQLEDTRMRKALERIQSQKIVLTFPEKPTPFAFPIMVDRLREKLSSEKLEDRIKKMKLQWE